MTGSPKQWVSWWAQTSEGPSEVDIRCSPWGVPREREIWVRWWKALNATLRSLASILHFPVDLGIRGWEQLWNSLSMVISAACQVVYLVQFTGRALLSVEKSLAPCESNHHGRHTSKREHTAASEKPAPHSGNSVHEYAFPTSDAAA